MDDLLVDGSALVLVGDFLVAGGLPAARTARWNGSDFVALGAVQGPVLAVARRGEDLVFGGDFSRVGDDVDAKDFAVWREDTVSTAGETPPLRTPALDIHPNPFNPRTTIRLAVGAGQIVSLRILDATGRVVRQTRIDTDGTAEFVWDGRDAQGHAVASGVYFAEVRTTAGTARGKMTLVR